VGCTSSHLEAIRQAIYDNRSTSRYAVIVEDDVHIPFNIDFHALVASAPPDFALLQLFNSNEGTMRNGWDKYSRNGFLWANTFQHQPAAFWSTCAYIIDRAALKPIIDKIAYVDNGWVNLKLAACLKKPCRPLDSECCLQPQSRSDAQPVFTDTAPCIWSVKGYMADSFIYALGKPHYLFYTLFLKNLLVIILSPYLYYTFIFARTNSFVNDLLIRYLYKYYLGKAYILSVPLITNVKSL
jgi:GR25 family glycosyltransferase involved in LPS biosynthesis